jgi:YVTN family beta-propeller protein
MKNFLRATAAAAAVLSLISCGGGTTVPQVIGEIPVPTNPPKFSFDIGFVDSGHYYVTDRTNQSLDVFDTTTLASTAVIKGGATPFAGVVNNANGSANNDKSGPDGVVAIPGTSILYVGDAGSVKVVDASLKQVIANIPIPSFSSTGTPGAPPTVFRADEGCYDPDDQLMMFAHPGDSPVFATWISTKAGDNYKIVAQYPFMTATGGLEQCAYDHASASFYLNNDATPTNTHGEVDIFTAASVKSGNPVISTSPAPFPLDKCNPTGLALGPGTDMIVMCAPDPGDPLISYIFNRTNGTKLATVKLGGADQVAYDSVSNRYFLALRYWSDTGISNISSANAASSPLFQPILGVVDASSYAIVAKVPAGRNCHSVAVDGPNHKAFVPHDSGATAFPNTGVTVVSTQ